MGYMSMDIIDHPRGAIWGKWNDRVVQTGWVSSLVTAYTKRFDNCLDENAMDIAVDPKWLVRVVKKLKADNPDTSDPDAIDPGASDPDATIPIANKLNANYHWDTVNGYDIDDVPEIRFTSEGLEAIKEDNLWVLGGNHRRLAVHKYLQLLKENLDEQTKTLAGKRKEDMNGGPTGDGQVGLHTDEHLAMAAEIERKTEALFLKQKWTVRLYNRGAHMRSPSSCSRTDRSHRIAPFSHHRRPSQQQGARGLQIAL